MSMPPLDSSVHRPVYLFHPGRSTVRESTPPEKIGPQANLQGGKSNTAEIDKLYVLLSRNHDQDRQQYLQALDFRHRPIAFVSSISERARCSCSGMFVVIPNCNTMYVCNINSLK